MHGIQMENNEKMHVNEKMHAYQIALSLKLTLSVPVLLSLSVPVLSFFFRLHFYFFRFFIVYIFYFSATRAPIIGDTSTFILGRYPAGSGRCRWPTSDWHARVVWNRTRDHRCRAVCCRMFVVLSLLRIQIFGQLN